LWEHSLSWTAAMQELAELEAERSERRRLSEQLEAERGRGFWNRLLGS
jgi:hypothetical protein